MYVFPSFCPKIRHFDVNLDIMYEIPSI